MFSGRLLLALVGTAGLAAADPAQAYDCTKKYCREMSSCAEARYQLSVCGYSGLDRDNDGIPCETICGSGVPVRSKPAAPALQGQPLPPPPGSAALMEMAPSEGSGAMACGSKRRCGQMESCAEARFYLSKCGVRSLDRDSDGVPCESLCGGR